MNDTPTKEAERTLLFFRDNDVVAVEPLAMHLSSVLSRYTHHFHALGELERLRVRSLATYCAPTESCLSQSGFPRYRLTEKGREVMEKLYDKAFDDAAYALYLKSDPA